MKIRLFLLLSLLLGSINAQSVVVKAGQTESRLQQLKKRVEKEVNEFVRCVKRNENCDQNRKRIYLAITALMAAVGLTVAGRIVKGYQKSKRRQPVVILPDAPTSFSGTGGQPFDVSHKQEPILQPAVFPSDYANLYDPGITSSPSPSSRRSDYFDFTEFGSEN